MRGVQQIKKIQTDDKKKFYNYLNLKLTGLICEESDWLANLSNASALLWLLLEDINWAGFYLYKNGELVLGPFQGKPACTHIQIGKGVCGTAAKELKTQVVEDVNKFEGHIACDSASKSEIVIPIVKNEKLVGVLDIDSPILNRFDKEDALYLEKFVDTLNKYMDWSKVI
ncbi:GAF domain-containing protein [Caldisalinibacter kiritimatiensis]|uniref:Free methionine-(R)-sulfoxide reductase n=1 Tax=Caldisalinibacter kiritimatiensis TaxID=1304284 RepID=R1CKJ4_9FIRM|nr:GAF domain-containing protein [Caldisalinibacter kiritimatiensis]EOC99245.1 Free methionine-(R)-sulfoxide reductase [Caldisalinibacter kiritimatiensis]